MYCPALESYVNVEPLVAGAWYWLSSTPAVIRLPFAGTIHCTLSPWTTWPAAFLRWNFTGTVLPPLKTLTPLPSSCAVSLIGCRKPLQAYSTLYSPLVVATLPARSVEVSVYVNVPTPFEVAPLTVTLQPSALTPDVASAAVQLMPVASPSV